MILINLKTTFSTLILLLICTWFIGCNSDDNIPEPTPILKVIKISPAKQSKLDLGEVIALTASGFDQFNKPYDISEKLVWSSNNTNVIVEQSGKITAASVGKSEIKATVEGIESSITITVWDSTAPRTEIYVSDIGNFEKGPWKILKFDEDGTNPEVFIGSEVNQPQEVLFLEDQEIVLISSYRSGTSASTGRITKFNSNTGAFIDNFATGLPGPTRIKIGPDDLLYVLLWDGNEKIRRYTLDGTFVDEFTSVGISQSIGLDWDANGNLYVSSFNGRYIRKFNTLGADLGLFVNSSLQGPTNIWFDEEGNLLVNDWVAGNVKKFDPNGVFVSTFISGLKEVEGAGFFDNGNILLGNGGTSSIKMFNSNGSFIKNLVPSGTGGLIRPNGITVRKVNF